MTADTEFGPKNTRPVAPPGLDPRRLLRLCQAAVERCELDLRHLIVLTEAATGAYAVTPLIAALAGADQVLAVTRDSRWGRAEDIRRDTRALLRSGGVEQALEIVFESTTELVGRADVVTNSGHLRPIDAQLVSWMAPEAVVTLMYEAWEFRPEDVDLAACRRHGIAVAGTNERHPAVDVFSYLGAMATKLLFDAGIAVHGSRLLVLSDNPFRDYLHRGLRAGGAEVELAERLAIDTAAPDAVLVALRPKSGPVIERAELEAFAERFAGTPLVRFWGDLPADPPLPTWPPGGAPGHMGVLPSDLGPEPVVRLQAGGLKVGEVLARARREGLGPTASEQRAVDSGFANLPDRTG